VFPPHELRQRGHVVVTDPRHEAPYEDQRAGPKGDLEPPLLRQHHHPGVRAEEPEARNEDGDVGDLECDEAPKVRQ